jgi:hypothetical protein
MPDTAICSAPLTSIERWAFEVLGGQNFKRRGPFAERHGSWELTFVADFGDGLYKFIDVTLSEDSPETHICEIWITAESPDRFGRKLERQFKVKNDEFESEDFERRLKKQLDTAVKTVRELQPDRKKKDFLRSKGNSASSAGVGQG